MPASEDQLKTWMVEGLDGNAASYAALLRALIPLLRAFYRRRVSDAEAIEDLVQDTLIAVHSRRITYDRERAFSAWLFSVARHKMIDSFRRNRATCPIDDFEHLLISGGFEEEINARQDIGRLLEDLPSKQSNLIRKVRIEGYSAAEAARELDLGESDVKVSVHRGLKALAARIRGAGR